MKRFIRDIHKTNERAERDKQRAKDEVARLNGAAPAASSDGSGQFKSTVSFTKISSRAATAEDRNAQMKQLAEMGVAVPEDFRRENAMAGDWQVVSQRVIMPDGSDASAAADGNGDAKANLNVGVRKRKAEDEDEEAVPKLEEGKRRPRWGTDTRALPGDDDDLDALLSSTASLKNKIEPKAEDLAKIKVEEPSEQEPGTNGGKAADTTPGAAETLADASKSGLEAGIKTEDEEPNMGAMFKKRKSKGQKQR